MINHHYACGVVESAWVADDFALLIQSKQSGSTFSDSSGNNVAITNIGSPIHSNASAKFGAYSVYLNGSGLALPAGFYPFGQPFTIDFWYRHVSYPMHGRVFYSDAYHTRVRAGILIGFYPNDSIMRFFSAGSDVSDWTCVAPLSMGGVAGAEFVHHAVVLDGSYAYGYRNGVLQAKVAQNGWPYYSPSEVCCWGREISPYSYAITAYMEEIAIRPFVVWDGSEATVGQQVFTPPTAPYL